MPHTRAQRPVGRGHPGQPQPRGVVGHRDAPVGCGPGTRCTQHGGDRRRVARDVVGQARDPVRERLRRRGGQQVPVGQGEQGGPQREAGEPLVERVRLERREARQHEQQQQPVRGTDQPRAADPGVGHDEPDDERARHGRDGGEREQGAEGDQHRSHGDGHRERGQPAPRRADDLGREHAEGHDGEHRVGRRDRVVEDVEAQVEAEQPGHRHPDRTPRDGGGRSGGGGGHGDRPVTRDRPPSRCGRRTRAAARTGPCRRTGRCRGRRTGCRARR